MQKGSKAQKIGAGVLNRGKGYNVEGVEIDLLRN